MFRIPRKLFITVGILAMLLASVAPASAGTGSAWEGLLSRVLAWLGGSEVPGFGAVWDKTSSSIDPLGQPGNSGKSDSWSSIDPDGQPKGTAIVPGDTGNSDYSSSIDPDGKPR